MDMMWKDEKLNVLDNPYGTCRARVNGNCPLAAEPPVSQRTMENLVLI